MNENIKAYLKKVAEDEELKARFDAVRDPDEAYALASSIQDGFTKEEFFEEMLKLDESMADEGELTDDDLVKVAGGVSTTIRVVVFGSVGVAAGV